MIPPLEGYRDPWREVVQLAQVQSPRYKARTFWAIVLECGHSHLRYGAEAPRKIRCDKCAAKAVNTP